MKELLADAHGEAKRILTAHQGEFEALARAVLERETLRREEIEAIVPPAPAQ